MSSLLNYIEVYGYVCTRVYMYVCVRVLCTRTG